MAATYHREDGQRGGTAPSSEHTMQGDRASPKEALSEPKRTIGHAFCYMDRAGKLTEREILAVWTVWTSGELDHAVHAGISVTISTFRTTSERPGV